MKYETELQSEFGNETRAPNENENAPRSRFSRRNLILLLPRAFKTRIANLNLNLNQNQNARRGDFPLSRFRFFVLRLKSKFWPRGVKAGRKFFERET